MRINQFVFPAIIGAVFCASAGAQTLFHDDFSGSIDPAWTIVRPDTSFYTIKPTELDLRVSRQDIDTGYNNFAKNLFLIRNPASGDFAITLKLNSFVPVSNNHAQIDLIALDDEDNLIRANYGYILGRRQAEFGTEIAANWVTIQTPLDMGNGSFYLRLTKIGTIYHQSYSTDGINYTTVNAPLHFRNGSPAFLGFCAGADPSDASHVHINSFTVEAVPEGISAVAATVASVPEVVPAAAARAIIAPTVTPAAAPMVARAAVTEISPATLPGVTLTIAPAVQIAWPTTQGKTYQVQSTPNFSPADWSNFGEPIVGAGSNMVVFDAAGADNQRYYRVLTSP